MMLKIAKIFKSPNGTQEPFILKFSPEELGVPELEGAITVHGNFLRVEEGIMMLIKEMQATQLALCSRCAKELKLPLNFKPSEWLFYSENPVEEDDENEHLQIDVHRLEIDTTEPVRQDLILNLEQKPLCKKPCKKFEEVLPGEDGVKALADLKDILKRS